MSDNEKTRDYTKTKLYVSLELASKVISAIALVALGIAGWMLQSQTEEGRVAAQDFERQERRYLPMLRSLSLLELELKDVAHELQQSKGDEMVGLGYRLQYAADSVFEPEGDPLVWIRSPYLLTGGFPDAKRIQVPLRATAIMYSELLRFLPPLFSSSFSPLVLRIDPAGALSVTVKGEDLTHVFSLSPDSLPAWQILLGNRSVELESRSFERFDRLLLDCRLAVVGVIQETLRTHVDLGDRYVQIRDDIEKSRVSTSHRQVNKSSE